jgi:hypothetical protein
MFSNRLPPHSRLNKLTLRLSELRAAGVEVVDLTESNPTRAGIAYSPHLLDSLSAPASLQYEPRPFGLDVARAAIAADHRRRGCQVDPGQVVLTASTSEAYAWLFKLLCNPGESVLVPRPSYPLFEHLTRLEGVRAEPYDLDYHGRWTIDLDALASAPDDARAVMLVSPNNPTGSFVTSRELASLIDRCRQRRWALVADEVFADYPLDEKEPLTDIATRADVLSFTLGGLSKSAGLPQLKLAWIVVGGPEAARIAALEALELVADSFLSVNTPVQIALPTLLDAAESVRTAIHERLRRNLTGLRGVAGRFPSCEVLRVDGGWSAVIRVPAVRSEERLVLDLLEHQHILVHPGYFFDFPREAYIVVSLLPTPQRFVDAITRVLSVAHS